MKNWLRPGRLVIVVVLLLVMALIVHRVFFKVPMPPQVTTATVEKGDIEDAVLATGTINAYKLVSVGARAPVKSSGCMSLWEIRSSKANSLPKLML